LVIIDDEQDNKVDLDERKKGRLDRPDLLRYTRQEKAKAIMHDSNDQPLSLPSVPESAETPLNVSSPNPDPVVDPNLMVDDSNVPIALRKGVRSCTQHNIQSQNLFHMVTCLHSIEPLSCLFLQFLFLPLGL
jgi:hypothetical protein